MVSALIHVHGSLIICFFHPLSLTISFNLLYLLGSSSSCFVPLCQSCSVTLFMLLQCLNKSEIRFHWQVRFLFWMLILFLQSHFSLSFVCADNLWLTTNRKKLKLTHFGLVREETKTEMVTTKTGAYRWMATQANKMDVYSFGIVLWGLLTNKMALEYMSNCKLHICDAAFKIARY